MVYLSDCQTGAVAGCVPGNNANAGTEAAPKRDLAGVSINTLPAGSTVLFKRGGAWNVATRIDNPNATSAAPITFADYGAGALPILNTPSGTTFSFGAYGTSVPDGGYTFRNLKLDGRGTGQWGVFVQGSTRDVTFDGIEATGFDIGIHSQQVAGSPNLRLTVKNSWLHHNREHGMLGAGVGFVFENNRVEDNNPSGGGFEHGTYFGSDALTSSGRIVGNTYLRNSAPNGTCDGGNMTLHGMWDGLTIEGNVIEQSGAALTCYGISVTAAYGSAEFFRNTVIRGNTIANVGACGLCISAAPGVLVEGNKVYNTRPTYNIGVQIPAIQPGAGDAADGGAVIRDNLICHSAPAAGSSAVQAPSAGSVTGNTYRTGADATTGPCAR